MVGDPFVEQLTRLCREHPVTPKWVILPALGIGWTLGERLLHEGCNWLNLRFTTPFQLALESCAPDLLARGLQPCPDGLGPPLLQRLLFQQQTGYFGSLALQPGMARALWDTLQEFRMAGLRAEDLLRLNSTPKRDDLHWLFQAYEKHLSDARWADRADVFDQVQTVHAIDPEDLVLCFPYCNWSPCENEFLSHLPGRRVTPEATDTKPPRGWPERIERPVQARKPQLFCALRRHDELDEVVKRILDQQLPLDEIEICALPEEASLIRERLAQAGMDATFEAGLPVASSRPGQAVNAILDWVEHGYTAFHLRELLLSDLIRARPNSFTAARLLHSARIGWGRHSYILRLRTLQAVYTQKQLPEAQEQCEQLIQWLSEQWLRLPEGDVSPAQWIQGLRSLIEADFLPRDGEAPARDGILRALAELAHLPGERWAESRLIHHVRQRVSALHSGATRPQAGKVHVTRPSTLGLSGRSHVFVVGLEEGRWLTRQPQDCILNDEERSRLHDGLRLSRDLPDYVQFQLRERMATVSGTLTLSYAVRDHTGEQHQVPSWIYVEAASHQLPPPVSRKQRSPLTVEALQRLHPHLHRGRLAWENRLASTVSDWDGYVPEAAGLWDPRNTNTPVSVSRLTALATCPYQVFLEHGLKVPKGFPRLPDADVWLDPLARGLLLHDVFATYYRERCAPEEMVSVLHRHLAELKSTFPPPSPVHEAEEVAELERDVAHFLKLENAAGARQPVSLEMPFGASEPVWFELDDGSSVPLTGRIDRVDQLADGLGVVDYKTGKSLWTASDALYDRGRLLQHGLYAVVAQHLLGPVVQSSYYFVVPGVARVWWHFSPPDRQHLGRIVRHILEPLATGLFVHTHERSDDCRFCDYRAACVSQPEAGTREKLGCTSNELLASRRNLLAER